MKVKHPEHIKKRSSKSPTNEVEFLKAMLFAENEGTPVNPHLLRASPAFSKAFCLLNSSIRVTVTSLLLSLDSVVAMGGVIPRKLGEKTKCRYKHLYMRVKSLTRYWWPWSSGGSVNVKNVKNGWWGGRERKACKEQAAGGSRAGTN